MQQFVCKEWIEEVLIVTLVLCLIQEELIDQFTVTGSYGSSNWQKKVKKVCQVRKQFVERVGWVYRSDLTSHLLCIRQRVDVERRLTDILFGG